MRVIGSTVEIYNSNFTDNSADMGGAVHLTTDVCIFRVPAAARNAPRSIRADTACLPPSSPLPPPFPSRAYDAVFGQVSVVFDGVRAHSNYASEYGGFLCMYTLHDLAVRRSEFFNNSVSSVRLSQQPPSLARLCAMPGSPAAATLHDLSLLFLLWPFRSTAVGTVTTERWSGEARSRHWQGVRTLGTPRRGG